MMLRAGEKLTEDFSCILFQLFSNFDAHQNHPESLLTPRFLGPTPRVSKSGNLHLEYLDDANALGPEKTLENHSSI